MDNKDFIQYENDGRTKLTTVFPTLEWRFTRDEYAPFDAVTNKKNKTVIAEIKTREFSTTQYKTCYLEVDKLIRLNSCNADTVIYVVHYNNNKTCTWNLTDLDEPTTTFAWMNEKTADGSQHKKWKEVIELELAKADIRYTSNGAITTQYINK